MCGFHLQSMTDKMKNKDKQFLGHKHSVVGRHKSDETRRQS